MYWSVFNLIVKIHRNKHHNEVLEGRKAKLNANGHLIMMKGKVSFMIIVNQKVSFMEWSTEEYKLDYGQNFHFGCSHNGLQVMKESHIKTLVL